MLPFRDMLLQIFSQNILKILIQPLEMKMQIIVTFYLDSKSLAVLNCIAITSSKKLSKWLLIL